MTEFYYFSTTWCGPCKVFKPVVQQVVADNGIPMQFIDAEQSPDLAAKFNVRSVPTIVVVKDGSVVFNRSGQLPKTQLANILTSFN